MKAGYKKVESILIFAILILDIYLLHLNVITGSYDKISGIRSTANYVKIDDVEVVEEQSEPIVYDNMTLGELSEKLERSLNSTISGKGYLIASYSLEKNVNPYMAVAIILHETGCKWECSTLVKECNNVGGQKGYGCGSYSYFDSLDEGIIAFIDNLSNNYINQGLTTPEEINPKYASSTTWADQVNKYIEDIKAR